jgi:hypothetical protein
MAREPSLSRSDRRVRCSSGELHHSVERQCESPRSYRTPPWRRVGDPRLVGGILGSHEGSGAMPRWLLILAARTQLWLRARAQLDLDRVLLLDDLGVSAARRV